LLFPLREFQSESVSVLTGGFIEFAVSELEALEVALLAASLRELMRPYGAYAAVRVDGSRDRLADHADMTVFTFGTPRGAGPTEFIFNADGCNAREGSLAKYTS
jgi:hypothetical protein